MSKNRAKKPLTSAANNSTNAKNIIIEHLPPELWLEVFQHLHVYDIILFRSCCKEIRQQVKQIKPLGQTFALNSEKMIEYFAANGYTTCIEYLISLGFDIDFQRIAELVASVGKNQNHFNILQLCEKNGVVIPRLASKCVEGQCNYTMLKYLCNSVYDVIGEFSHFWPRFELAAKHGHYECMKLLSDLGFGKKHITYTPSMKCLQYFVSQKASWSHSSFIKEAANEGDLQMIKKAVEYGVPAPLKFTYIKTVECIEYISENFSSNIDECVLNAIQKNNIDVVKYFIKTKDITEMNSTLEMIALSASKEMYQLLMKLPFDGNTGKQDPSKMYIATVPPKPIPAINFKHMFLRFDSPYINIIRNNDIETFKFAFEKWPLIGRQAENAFQLAIYSQSERDNDNEDIDMIKFIYEKCKIDVNNATDHAARYGSVKVLNFLTEKGAKWTAQHTITASKRGRFESLVYLHKIGCPWNSDTCNYAGSVLCLKYAREHGCKSLSVKCHFFNGSDPGPWTVDLWQNLFENLEYKDMKDYFKVKWAVNVPILRYAVWHSCPMDKQTREDVIYLMKLHPLLNIRFSAAK